MAYRTWLKDVKNIADLGQQLVVLNWEKPESDKRGQLRDRRWFDLFDRELPASVQETRFFRSKLHDSWIFGFERAGKEFFLPLESEVAMTFISELGIYLDLDLPDYPYEVRLLCHDVSYQTWVMHDTKGRIIWRRPQFSTLTKSRFVYDWFFEQDGRLQWIVSIDPFLPKCGIKGNSDLILMVDCESVGAVDLAGRDIEARFGPKVRLIWDRFCSQTEFDVWDQPRLFGMFEDEMRKK